MVEYRRSLVAGGTYFFTLVTANRQPIFAEQSACALLGDVIRRCQQRMPFTIDAIVLLPDHLHLICTLPEGDHHYSARLSVIKRRFTNRYQPPLEASDRSHDRRPQVIWQDRFWEHTIRDNTDYQHHLDYIHFNPVKHGFARCPSDWKHSSFRRWVNQGVYEMDWACAASQPAFTCPELDAGEP